MQLLPWSHVSSAGFTLCGWHTAPSGKPLLHFLHGNGFCSRAYEPMLRVLAEDFDLWLCDLQGHGQSDHGGHFLGWNRNAALAVEAFEAGRGAFGEVPRFALGHSFGGVLSSLILAEHPRLFRRAVLLDPVLFGPGMLGMMGITSLLGLQRRLRLAQGAARRRKHWPSRQAAFDALHGRGIFRGWHDEALGAYVEHALVEVEEGGVALRCQPSREAEVFASFPRGLWPALRRVTTQTLVLHGCDSYPFVTRAALRWSAMNPKVSQRVVEGGHCFMQEQPEATAQKVRSFLLEG